MKEFSFWYDHTHPHKQKVVMFMFPFCITHYFLCISVFLETTIVYTFQGNQPTKNFNGNTASPPMVTPPPTHTHTHTHTPHPCSDTYFFLCYFQDILSVVFFQQHYLHIPGKKFPARRLLCLSERPYLQQTRLNWAWKSPQCMCSVKWEGSWQPHNKVIDLGLFHLSALLFHYFKADTSFSAADFLSFCSSSVLESVYGNKIKQQRLLRKV